MPTLVGCISFYDKGKVEVFVGFVADFGKERLLQLNMTEDETMPTWLKSIAIEYGRSGNGGCSDILLFSQWTISENHYCNDDDGFSLRPLLAIRPPTTIRL